jgi:hypothetical protein
LGGRRIGDEFARASQPAVVRAPRCDVDLDELRGGADPRLGQKSGNDRISPQVRVALSDQTDRDADQLGPDLGDGQRHARGLRERLPDLAASPFFIAFALASIRFEYAAVGRCVGPCEGHDFASELLRPLG